jgi:hypothetical protein
MVIRSSFHHLRLKQINKDQAQDRNKDTNDENFPVLLRSIDLPQPVLVALMLMPWKTANVSEIFNFLTPFD